MNGAASGTLSSGLLLHPLSFVAGFGGQKGKGGGLSHTARSTLVAGAIDDAANKDQKADPKPWGLSLAVCVCHPSGVSVPIHLCSYSGQVGVSMRVEYFSQRLQGERKGGSVQSVLIERRLAPHKRSASNDDVKNDAINPLDSGPKTKIW